MARAVHHLPGYTGKVGGRGRVTFVITGMRALVFTAGAAANGLAPIHDAQVATHRADDPYDKYKEDMDVWDLLLGRRPNRAQAIGVSLRGGIFGVSMASFPATSESHDALECARLAFFGH